MRIKLVVVGGEVKVREVAVPLPVTIGRGKEASLQLPHRLVSRAHCRIYADGDKAIVEDLGSLNGTFVNNQRIETPTALPMGQLLTVGDVTFRLAEDAGGQDDSAGSSPATETVDPSEATVHSPTARGPSAFVPDFQAIASEDAGAAASDSTEEPPGDDVRTEEDESNSPASPAKPSFPKFEPRRRR